MAAASEPARRGARLALGALLAAASLGCAWFRGDGAQQSPPSVEARPPALPPALETAIARDFPELRVPTARDRRGAWTEPSRETPYRGSGDFDGDGRADFVLILISPRRWTLAVYLQDARRTFRLAPPPAQALPEHLGAGAPYAHWVRVLRAGSPYAFTREEAGHGYTGKSSHTVRFDHDAFVFASEGRDDTVFYWGDGRFELLAAGSTANASAP
jgi:hypothetical protein